MRSRIERLPNIPLKSILCYIPLADRGKFRQTSKANERRAKLTFTLATCVEIGPYRHSIPRGQKFSWFQLRRLKEKFSFRGLRYLIVPSHQVAFPFGEILEQAPRSDVGIVVLRDLMDELRKTLLVITSKGGSHWNSCAPRWADKLVGMPRWAECDRWRFAVPCKLQLHPRLVRLVGTLKNTEWGSGDDMQYLPVGKYPAMRVCYVGSSKIHRFAKWLEASELPVLSEIEIQDDLGTNCFTTAVPSNDGNWVSREIRIKHHHQHDVLPIIRAVENKTGTNAQPPEDHQFVLPSHVAEYCRNFNAGRFP